MILAEQPTGGKEGWGGGEKLGIFCPFIAFFGFI
jgi:hypothetical protein